MRYSFLRGTGLQVSQLCLGTATFGLAPHGTAAEQLVHQALEHGINFFDTANSYGNQTRFDRGGMPLAPDREWAEQVLGDALVGQRDHVVLASKVSEPIAAGPNSGSWEGGGMTRSHVTQQLHESLRRLKTDYLDIYHVHHADQLTETEEWISTLDDFIRAGKIRHYGISTFSGWQAAETVLCARHGRYRAPACHQTRMSLVDRWIETDVIPASRHFGVSMTIFSPLAGGLLTSSFREPGKLVGDARWGGDQASGERVRAVQQIHEKCAQWELPVEGVALNWVLAKAGVASAIVGPESAHELNLLVEATDSVELDAEQLQWLDGAWNGPSSFWG